jgi:hypothetical protein
MSVHYYVMSSVQNIFLGFKFTNNNLTTTVSFDYCLLACLFHIFTFKTYIYHCTLSEFLMDCTSLGHGVFVFNSTLPISVFSLVHLEHFTAVIINVRIQSCYCFFLFVLFLCYSFCFLFPTFLLIIVKIPFRFMYSVLCVFL